MKTKIAILCSCLLFAGGFGLLLLHGQNDLEFRMAPLNPAYLRMIEAKQEGAYVENPKLGYRPAPFEFTNIQAIAPLPEVGTLPTSYDLRNYNKVNAIRDQGSCGSCWAFATMASVESSLLPGEVRNFSEQHLNKYHGFDNPECGGGGSYMSAAYFARGDGPYNETDYPYPYSSNAAGAATVQKHVQKVVWLPNDGNTIKTFLSDSSYGAIFICFYSDSLGGNTNSYYNASNYAYYYPTAHDTDHCVAIIGWDDNFSKTKFSTTPPGDGAWLCRNSWGTSFGISGYFWMSYYDATVASFTAFSSVQPATSYTDIYQYDPLGVESAFGNGTTTFWGANIFTATSNNPIKAIGYFANDAASITYYVYKNPSTTNPTSGTLAVQGTASVSYPGYYTTDLSSPVTVATGDRFSVVIKYANNSYKYPLCLESYQSGYSSAATNAAGQSFYSSNGSSWTDIYTAYSNAYKFNCCIKAFSLANMYTLTISSSSSGTTNPVPGTYSYLPGTDVSIQATPNQYCVFMGWSGDASGTSSPISVHMDANKSVTATFKLVNAPSNLTAARYTNRSLLQIENVVDLAWTANSANSGLSLAAYRIYQLVGDSWTCIYELATSSLTYRVRLAPAAATTFGLTSVTSGGVESAKATIVK